jgi:four helix bundle protein
MLFDFERLELYPLIREFNREVAAILSEIPRGNAETKDNLERAAKSIGRNFAEGAGRWLIADKVHFYQFARGSGTEGARSLDELVDWGLVPPERILKAKELAWRIVNILTSMIRTLESLPERSNAPKTSAAASATASARRLPVPGGGAGANNSRAEAEAEVNP